MKTAPTLSIRDLTTTAAEMVSSAIILHPQRPAEILADEVADEAEMEFQRQFGRYLMVGFFARAIRSERAKQRRAQIPEQFRHLPLFIRLPDGSRVRMDKITYSQARRFYQSLGKRHDEKKKTDARRLEAKLLMDSLYQPARKERGITAGEALGFNFED